MLIRLPDAFCKNASFFSTVTDPGCVVIRKCIFNAKGFMNNIFENNTCLTMHLFFVLFYFQFYESPTIPILKNFQTAYKRMLCDQNL